MFFAAYIYYNYRMELKVKRHVLYHSDVCY